MSTHVELVMGTAVSIDTPGMDASRHQGVGAVCAWLHRVDRLFSPYRPGSAVSRISTCDLRREDAPAVVRGVLDACEHLRARTGGYFDVWSGAALDPSGYVKGWSVDVAASTLARSGLRNFSINAGGDICTRGRPGRGRDWTVGIAHPIVRGALCRVVTLGAGAVATSGTSERGPHVRDPHTGRAVLDLAGVTVLAPDLTTADVYATAALARGLDAPEWLLDLHRREAIEAYVVDAGGYEWATPGFDDRCVAA